MKDRSSQLTLRELRTAVIAYFSRPTVVAALFGASLLLGISGPFDTLSSLNTVPRLAYWTLVVWLTYACGTTIYLWTFSNDQRPKWVSVLLASALAGVLIGLLLNGVNALFLRIAVSNAAEVLQTILYAAFIALIVNTIMAIASPSPSAAGNAESPAPALLRRLPFEKRGALVSLSVEDHYVRVTTTQGREMILMRLRDAIDETAPIDGLQIHRSHWVALGQIESVVRRGDGAMITTSAGDALPVSRSSMPEVRARNLLPMRNQLAK